MHLCLFSLFFWCRTSHLSGPTANLVAASPADDTTASWLDTLIFSCISLPVQLHSRQDRNKIVAMCK